MNERLEAIHTLEGVFESAMGSPFFQGNRIEILQNGTEIFPAMLEALDEASETVDFLTFVYWEGEIARRFAGALSAAARRGVAVRVLLDAVGSMAMDPSLFEGMRAAGVNIRKFRPVSQWIAPWKMTHRTHRKILVCDGRVAFTGGVGIAEEWSGDARGPGEWRDTHFRLRGPAVRGLESAFLGNWLEVEPHASLDRYQRPTVTSPQPEGPARIQVVRSTAAVEWSDLATLVRVLIGVARRRIRISTPYFVPDERIAAALRDAATRGISIEILVPGDHTDHRVAQRAGEASYGDLLSHGVEIWEYERTLIHQKIVAVDDILVATGSGNLNQRSLLQDDEVQLVVLDTQFAAEIAAMLDRDFQRARRIREGTWKRRPWPQRIASRFAHLFRRQL